MKLKKLNLKIVLFALIIGVLNVGFVSHSDITAVGQAQRGSITVTVTDSDGIVVGDSVEFNIQVNDQSDPGCDDGSWTLDYGDGRSSSGMATGKRTHNYLRSGAYNAVVNYTYFEDVGAAAPQCEARMDSDSVAVVVNEAEMPEPATPSEPVRFVGTDSNWFDPNNWEGGRVPGDGDSVVIAGDALVVIDPGLDPRDGKVSLQDFNISGNARVETRPGTVLEFDTMSLGGGASIFTTSSATKGKTFQGGGGCAGWECGYNPSYVEIEDYNFGESIALYLGGTTQASESGVGPGHYSFIDAERVALNDASLQINTIYDFEPLAGDEFVIIEASESLTGSFSNFADGDVVLTTDDVNIIITYTNTQIILTAEEL